MIAKEEIWFMYPSSKTNRRFIEDDGNPEHLNFLDAHSSSSYEFIFDFTINDKAGYVYPRN